MIYLLYGNDEFIKEEQLKKIKKSIGELHLGINYIKIDNINLSEILDNIETPAFGYETKTIEIRKSGLFKKETAELKKFVENFTQNDFEYINLIFIEDEISECNLLKFVRQNGKIIECKELPLPALIDKMSKIAAMYKVRLDQYNARYLIETVGTNMQDLINEVRKLIEYAGESGTIQKEDIDALAIKKSDSIIFDLTDSLGKKQIKYALQVYSELAKTPSDRQMILIQLYRHFKKLYLLKNTENDSEIISNLKLKPNQTFLVRKYKEQAGHFKTEDLKNILKELIKIDEKYKIGEIDLSIGIELVLCKYCS